MKKMSWSGSYARLLEVLLVLPLLVSFSYVFPRWADPNQNSRLDMVVAVVDDGTFAIDKYVSNTVDYAKYNGHYYSDKPPGTAFIGIPIYAGLKVLFQTPVLDRVVQKLADTPAFQATLRAEGSGIYKEKVRFAIAQVVLTFFIAVIPSLILAVLLFRLCVSFKLPPLVAFFTAAAYSLLSPAFPYANALYGHQLSSALLVGSFFLIYRAREISVRRLLLVGALLAYAVITEYPTVLIAGVISIYALVRLIQKGQGLKISWLALTALLGLSVILIYNTVVFGGPLSLGYEYSENWTTQHQTGFMSLTLPHLQAVWGITFGVFRGLFVLSPLVLWAFPGFVFWFQQKEYRPEFLVSLASVVLMFLFNSSSSMWWGGYSVGPRYLLAAMPFLFLGVGFCLERLSNRPWFKVLFALSSLISLVSTWGISLAGQAFPPDTIANPFVGYAWPNWVSGNIARNFGTVLGLSGVNSPIPLVLVWLVAIAVIIPSHRGHIHSSHPVPTNTGMTT